MHRDWGSDTCHWSVGSHIFRLLAGWQFPLITSDEKRKRRPLRTQVLRIYWLQLVRNLSGLRAQIGHCRCTKPIRHAWHDYHRAVQVTPQHTHAHSICMWGHCGCNCFTVFLGIFSNVWSHVLDMWYLAFSLIVGSHAAIGKHDFVGDIICIYIAICLLAMCLYICVCLCARLCVCVYVCVRVCVCVCVCVCVPVSAEAKKVGQKGGRSAANRSGIRMVENCGFSWFKVYHTCEPYTTGESVYLCDILVHS